ncbi:hypothetical protein HNP86_001858 [Methanococcus maripaludis]|uniref:Uncharacterized protein n=1 Tax=Methanococcus maripaludis TaxID=39152 RepID=A0A7J9NVJ7_METMI|nr:hypothetical protein [Methanococcus maripaludis]MBA2851699.1 hypothetical protein [Methanococcus maripaludis]
MKKPTTVTIKQMDGHYYFDCNRTSNAYRVLERELEIIGVPYSREEADDIKSLLIKHNYVKSNEIMEMV